MREPVKTKKYDSFISVGGETEALIRLTEINADNGIAFRVGQSTNLGKPIFESLPEGVGQGIERILIRYIKPGWRFALDEASVEIPGYGTLTSTINGAL